MIAITIPGHSMRSKAALQALGRLKSGSMNRTESSYSGHLERRRMAGEILWWRFEAIKLRLADNTFLTVDFFVMLANGELEAHDVKGSRAIVQDDAWAKMKIAAEYFPFRFYVCFPLPRSKGSAWDIEEV